MEVAVKMLNTANATASGVIASKDLEEKITKIATRLSKTIKMDGFRKGKVPLSLVRARYADGIKQDAQKETVQDMLQDALKELNIQASKMVGDPIITKFEEKADRIDVEIKISLNPEVKIDGVDSCIPKFKAPEVSEKEIKKRLEEIAKREAPFVAAPKTKTLDNGDLAVFDFEGFVDGEAFDGGKAEKFELTIGSGQFIAGFEDSMLGMKSGEQKDITVTFPKDYQASHLAGKEAVFKIKLHEIKVKEKVELNDELAKKALPQNKEATLKDLEDEVAKQLRLEAKTKLYNEELKQALVENFSKDISFDLPDLIVEQEMDILFRNSLNTLEESELKNLREDATKAKEKRETFREDAQKSVKVTFIVDALARKHGISIQDNEVYQTIYYEAMMMGQNPQDAIEYYRSNNLLPAIKMAMIEDRVLTYLLDSQMEEKNPPAKKASDTKATKTEKTASKTTSSKTTSKTASKKKGQEK